MARKRSVGVREVKMHFSRLLRAVEAGAEVVVLRRGRPVARIMKASAHVAPEESYGMFAGQFTMTADFDAGTQSLADAFGVGR